MFTPIGNDGWWPRGGTRADSTSSPSRPRRLILAAAAAYGVTQDAGYIRAAEAAYGWFLGDNDAGLVVADVATGGCHDGLAEDHVNPNQGAESTLMWLTALETMRSLRTNAMAARQARCARRRDRPDRGPRVSPSRRLGHLHPASEQPDHHRRPASLPRQLGLQPRRRARGRRDAAARPRRGPARHLPPARRAQQRRCHRLALRRRAADHARTGPPPRGDLGLRGPATDVAAGARSVGDRLHRLQPARSARLAGVEPATSPRSRSSAR